MSRRARGTHPKLQRTTSVLLAAGALCVATQAEAQVTEPDGLQIPIDFSLSRDIGGDELIAFPLNSAETLSLPALFAARGEDIDWLMDASTEPAYFSPLCGFHGQMVLRGGGCEVDFGWYNVDLTTSQPPLDAEIYPLVTKEQLALLPPFQPRIGDPPIEGELLANIRTDPRYAGGLIGLAVRGEDGTACSQSKYSESRLNVQCTICDPPSPWITALIWQSTATPNAFYIGFEDLPMAEDDFQGPPDRWYPNDGDFNDFVYFVEGITCMGGGQPCLTTAEGACAFGLTECLPDGTLECVQNLQARDEVCDNIDNNCDGLVDEGDLCDPGYVCHQGVCKPNCSGGEFPCSSPLVCDSATGYCVDPACVGVVCEEQGQVCLDGVCVGGCSDDVVCPIGQICQLGRCVDPCVSRRPGAENECQGGMVCEAGVCVEPCECRVCPTGTECDATSSMCVSIGCAGVECPAGEFCRDGVCGDACAGVICPGGADCNAGKCADPIPGQDTGDAGAGGAGNPPPPPLIDVDAGVIVDAGAPGGAAGAAASSGSAANSATGSDTTGDEPGCGCRAVGGDRRAIALSALLLMALGLGVRRRRVRASRR